MKYDFDEIVDRVGTNAAKYESRNLHPELPDDYIPMFVADMDFACPQPILDAMKARIDRRILGYSSMDAEYFEILRAWLKRRHGWEIDPQSVLFHSGVVECVRSAVHNVTKPGDYVVFQTPAYHPFEDSVKNEGRLPLFSQLLYHDGSYTVDWDDFEQKVKNPKTSAFILCNPQNPTGRVWTEEELRRMAELCWKNDVFIISDDIHKDFVGANYTYIPLAKLYPDEKRLITCISPSKTFNVAGNQFANMVFNDLELKKSWPRTGRPNPVSLAGSKAAFSQCDDWVDEMNAYLDESFRILEQRLDRELPGVKPCRHEGTYLAWIDMSALQTPEWLLRKCIFEAGLYCEYSFQFVDNGKGFMRMNLACPHSVLNKGIDFFVKGCLNAQKLALVKAGEKMPDFNYESDGTQHHFQEEAAGQRHVLLFLRDPGCPICQMKLDDLCKESKQLADSKIKLFAVLPTSKDAVLTQFGEDKEFPYSVIYDPEQKLYDLYHVCMAENTTQLSGPGYDAQKAKARTLGYQKVGDLDKSLRIPAAFAADETGTVTLAHYGYGAADIPTAHDIIASFIKN